jgi:hypothetical protein
MPERQHVDFKLYLPKTVAANIEHFSGRTWLLPTLLDWFEQTDARMFILTGEPGTGKSTVAAWLAGAGPWPSGADAKSQLEQIRSQIKAAHFCVAASDSAAPKAFAQSMAEQLTHNVADSAMPWRPPSLTWFTSRPGRTWIRWRQVAA